MYLLNHINTQGSRAALPSLCSSFRLLPAMFFSEGESLWTSNAEKCRGGAVRPLWCDPTLGHLAFNTPRARETLVEQQIALQHPPTTTTISRPLNSLSRININPLPFFLLLPLSTSPSLTQLLPLTLQALPGVGPLVEQFK